MQKSEGQKLGGVHGPARHYEWIAPKGTKPSDLPAALEAVLPGVKLYHRGYGEVHGCISTAGQEDGTLLVIVTLYDDACGDPKCKGAHMNHEVPVSFKVAPALTELQETAMVKAVGEVKK